MNKLRTTSTNSDNLDDRVDVYHGFDLVLIQEIFKLTQPVDHCLDVCEQFVVVSFLGGVQFIFTVLQP
jgi:hypothetical protein